MPADKGKKDFLLPAEMDDDDDDSPSFGTPDDDGWVNLSRRSKDAGRRSTDGDRKTAGKNTSRRAGTDAGKKARPRKRRRSDH